MKPIGRTYLIECEKIDDITKEGDIYVVNSVDKVKDGFWKGVVKEYGTLLDGDDLVPIGTKVVMDTTKKAEAKLVLGKKVYYIKKEDEIIGVIEDE